MYRSLLKQKKNLAGTVLCFTVVSSNDQFLFNGFYGKFRFILTPPSQLKM